LLKIAEIRSQRDRQTDGQTEPYLSSRLVELTCGRNVIDTIKKHKKTIPHKFQKNLNFGTGQSC